MVVWCTTHVHESSLLEYQEHRIMFVHPAENHAKISSMWRSVEKSSYVSQEIEGKIPVERGSRSWKIHGRKTFGRVRVSVEYKSHELSVSRAIWFFSLSVRDEWTDSGNNARIDDTLDSEVEIHQKSGRDIDRRGRNGVRTGDGSVW